MQRKQGYCSYCRVQYPNLEQHLFSSQHRSLTRQNRRQISNNSLMERFLQDVLRHHPYNYQENRSPNDTPSDATSPDVVCVDEFFPEETTSEDATETSEESLSESSESVEELCCGPSKYQERAQEVSVRPSVIQKLEKGQQQSLQFVHKIESGMRKVNPVDIGQATNNGKNLIRPPVICNAPASRLPASSYDRPVAATTTRLPLAASLDSVSKCDPNKVGKHFEKLDIVSRNPVPSSRVETSPVSHKNLKESNRKSLHVNSDKLVVQKDVKSQGATLSPGSKFPELKGTENSVRVKSSKLAVNSAVNLNKTGKPSDKGTFEDAIPKRRGEVLSKVDCTQEERLLLKKSSFLEQKCSASPEAQFDYGPLQSASDQSQEAVQDLHLWKEEQVDQEDGSDESGGSGMSFDCGSSCHSLTDQSEVSDREITLLEEIHADLEYKNNKSCVSEVSSDCNDSVQAVTNQSQVIVKETGLQNTVRISLVDQSYGTSGSEMNSDCEDDLPQSTNDRRRQQPVKEVNFPQGVRIDLVDRDYGSGSSEASADSVCSLESVDEEPPVVVTEKKLGKKSRVKLVDASYGSSYSESSSDSEVPLQSVVDRQVTVKERKPKDRHVHLKQKKRKSTRAKACPHCDVSHETVPDEPQRAVEEKNLLKEKKADLLDMNCESHGPEMGFHADAQLVADRSQVAVKEVNPQKVDIDLDNKSVQSSISYLSFDSHAFLYQSANDQPQGALGEINLKELNVDMEVKSYGCSSSELTFDSDSPLLSVTERFQLDVERINEDDFYLEDESCESSSSDITFDSDIHDCSVVDQPEVAVYEEEPVDLENKSNESCISEITFDSDIPLHSGNDQPEVAVKEVIIQEEEYVLLERKNDKPSGSEISLDSYAPLHSLTNPLEVADKKLNSQKEEQVHLKNKKNVPTYSELNLAYDTIFHSMTGHTEDPIKDINFQKEEHVHLENKSNELSVSKTRLDFDIPLQSMIHKPEVVVKNIWLQKEKHAEFQSNNAEFSGSAINSDSDIPHYPMTEPQVPLKKRETKKHILEKKSDKHGGSELILSSTILPQSMTEKPQLAVLNKDHVDPADESSEIRGFEINLNIDSSLHSVTDQPHMTLLKEKHVDLKDENSKLSDSKISFTSLGPSQSFPEQHKTVKKINLWKKEVIGLENKIDEPYGSKVIHDTDVSLQSAADQPEVAIEQRNLENEDQMYLDSKNSQHSSHSDCLVQAIVDQPQITILGPEHTEIEGKHNQSCDSELSFDSDDSLLSVSDKLRETVKEISLWKDEDVDMQEKRDEAKSFETVCDSDVLQPVASQTEEVVEKSTLWKEHVDMEDTTVKPSNSKINFYSDEPLQSVTNKIQEPREEVNLPREGHVCLDDKGYEPNGSKIIYVSNIPFQSVIQRPQMLGEKDANLEVKSSGPCGPEISFDSSDSCQSVADQLQKAVNEINLKEDHIYLEDKSYKLVDCEACYDSDVPVQFVEDQSDVAAKEISLQEKDHNDLENNNYIPYSEIRCDSDVHLQSEVDPPQAACNEIIFQKRELGMEEKSSEHSDSEMMYDSDVSFQILVNPSQLSDGESDSPEVVFVDVMASDSDCDREVISDPNLPIQLVTDPSQMTVQETSCINAESVETENNYCSFCGSEVRCVSEDPSRPVRNQPKESFKIINRKNDYIILGDSTCQSCGHEIDFNVDASDQSMTYQSQGPDKKCIDSEDRSCESNGSERNFNMGDTSQSVIYQLQNADKDVNPWKDPNNIGLKDNSWEPSVSAVDCAAPSTSVIHHVAGRKSILKLKHTEGSTSRSEMDFQCDPSLQSGTDQPQAVNKKRRPKKKVTFDLREYHDTQSSSVPMDDSVRNLEKATEVIEDVPDEPVLEASPDVPPSFVGKTWSQIVRENEMKIDSLVKEFREGRFYCYFGDNSKTKKVVLNEEKKTTLPVPNQVTVSVQTQSHHVCTAGGTAPVGKYSVALGRSCCHYALEDRLFSKQKCHMASQSQAEKVSHGTQTSFMSYPLKKRKCIRQEEESPKKKCSECDGKEKKKVKIGTVEEDPASQTNFSEPAQSKSSVRVLSSVNLKPKEGESCNLTKMNHCTCDNEIQFRCKDKHSNLNDPSKVVNDPSVNLMVPESSTCKCGNIHRSGNDVISSAGENDAVQNLASTSTMTLPARYELRSRYRTSESSTFLENPEVVNVREIPEEGFQLTLLSRGVARISPKSVRNEVFQSKSKKNIQRGKVTASSHPSFPPKAYEAIILQQKNRIASEKWSIWIRTKANDIIRKYISKYSVFLRRRYQSRTTFIGMHSKKNVAGRLEEVERSSQMLLNTSVPPAGAKEQLRAITSPLKQPVQRSSSAAGRQKPKKKNCRRKKKRPTPVREYDLRSSCYIPDSDRMMTRLASKLRSNEVK